MKKLLPAGIFLLFVLPLKAQVKYRILDNDIKNYKNLNIILNPIHMDLNGGEGGLGFSYGVNYRFMNRINIYSNHLFKTLGQYGGNSKFELTGSFSLLFSEKERATTVHLGKGGGYSYSTSIPSRNVQMLDVRLGYQNQKGNFTRLKSGSYTYSLPYNMNLLLAGIQFSIINNLHITSDWGSKKNYLQSGFYLDFLFAPFINLIDDRDGQVVSIGHHFYPGGFDAFMENEVDFSRTGWRIGYRFFQAATIGFGGEIEMGQRPVAYAGDKKGKFYFALKVSAPIVSLNIKNSHLKK